MDYSSMIEFHMESAADITVAVQPVAAGEAYRFGLLKKNPDGRIAAFVEKPRDPDVLAQFVSRDEPERPYLGSMGIYVFNTPVLVDLLENSAHEDFGGQIIPNAINTHDVYGFDFDGYWEDIGTIRSFYETNLSLTRQDAPFNFYDPVHPIYTRQRYLPSTVIDGATLHNVMLTEGCLIRHAEISDSIVGLRSIIADGVLIKNSIIMGADYYDEPALLARTGVPLGIGKNCHIEGAIIDKNVRMGEGVTVCPFPRGTEMDAGSWSVQDGIVVIPKSTTLHPGTYIGPD
jgi:glucose-1-phosphate adenylyltransferase